MFSVVMGAVAYTLLISSFVTFVILLKKQFTQWMNTAFYILSMSDVLCSILIAGVLLVNHIQDLNNTNYIGHNNVFPLNNTTWEEEEVNEENYQNTIKKFDISDNMTAENNSNMTAENNSNITMSYCITNIMMQYAMLLLPLTNSFISLLIFTTQCNLNLIYLKNRCTKFFQFQENQMNKNEEKIEKPRTYDGKYNIEIIGCELEDTTMKHDSNLDLGKYSDSSITSKISDIDANILQRFKFNGMEKHSKKILSVFVLSQWIIPFLAIGTLYFGEYNTEYLKSSESTECSIDNNFFFNNCCYNENITSNINLGMYIPLHKNFIHNENVWRPPNPNDTQVHTIVSKIQSIIFSAMNDTSKIQNITPTTFYDNFELLDEAKNVQSNTNVSKSNKNNVKSEYNFTDEIAMVHDIIYDTFPYKQNETSTTDENITYILYDELLTTERQEMEAIKNDEVTSENYVPYYENVINTEVLSKLQSTMQSLVEATTSHEVIDVSSDQIYAEILKRIHGTNWYYNVKQPKQHKFEQQMFQNNSDLIKNIFPIVNSNINKTYDTSDIDKTQIYMTNKCYISNRFLKLYFLLLAFLVYFLPILLSSILQVHGKLTCQIILYKYRTRNQTLCTNCTIDRVEGTNDITSVDIEKESNSSGSSMFTKKRFHQMPNKSSEILQEIQIDEEFGNTKLSENSKNNTVLNDKEKYMSIVKQIEDIQKLFDTNKISLLCATLLWTPVFLKVLFKIFLCLQISKWLLSTAYLFALTFNLLRNIFNLKMIRLQNSITNATKGNSIFPIN